MIFFVAFSTIAAVASRVSAQTPDACIAGCIMRACPDYTNHMDCFCNTGVQDIEDCLRSNCTTADFQTVTNLGEQFCNGSSTTLPGADNTTSTTSGSSATNFATSTHTSAGSTSSLNASKSASSASNIGNSGLAAGLALAVAIAVTVGVVA